MERRKREPIITPDPNWLGGLDDLGVFDTFQPEKKLVFAVIMMAILDARPGTLKSARGLYAPTRSREHMNQVLTDEFLENFFGEQIYELVSWITYPGKTDEGIRLIRRAYKEAKSGKLSKRFQHRRNNAHHD